jgi:hypothetical protein
LGTVDGDTIGIRIYRKNFISAVKSPKNPLNGPDLVSYDFYFCSTSRKAKYLICKKEWNFGMVL